MHMSRPNNRQTSLSGKLEAYYLADARDSWQPPRCPESARAALAGEPGVLAHPARLFATRPMFLFRFLDPKPVGGPSSGVLMGPWQPRRVRGSSRSRS